MKKQFLLVFICVLFMVGSACAGPKIFRGGVKILPQDGITLEIPTLNKNGQKGIDLGVSVDTDGDTVYGQHISVDAGSADPATAGRFAYGVYLALTASPGWDAGWNHETMALGSVYRIDATADASTYANTIGFLIDDVGYSGNNQDILGANSQFRIGGSGSYGTGYLVYISLEPEGTPISQSGYGYRSRLGYMGSTDIFYGMHVEDAVDAWVTGGTAYGSYIDLDDADYDEAWSYYAAAGSAHSYFGSPTKLDVDPIDGDYLANRGYNDARYLPQDINAVPASDHTANGPKTNDINAGESVTVIDCLYLHSDGEWHKTDADNATTAEGMLAVSLESKTDGQAMNVAMPGNFIRDDSWTWTVGQEIYLALESGNMTQAAPSGVGDVVRIVGHATHADRMFFRPEQTIVVHN